MVMSLVNGCAKRPTVNQHRLFILSSFAHMSCLFITMSAAFCKLYLSENNGVVDSTTNVLFDVTGSPSPLEIKSFKTCLHDLPYLYFYSGSLSFRGEI